jgi:hypothetical protein
MLDEPVRDYRTLDVGRLFEPPSVTWQGYDAETDAAPGMVLKIAIAISARCAFMDRLTVVTATTRHTPIAAWCSLRIDRGRAGVGLEPILAPLPDIAQHVIKAEGVRRLLADRMRRPARRSRRSCPPRRILPTCLSSRTKHSIDH